MRLPAAPVLPAAIVGDALSYLSYETVFPVFREVTLEQKGLRNDDSIEMLNIIIDSVVPDLVNTYGVGGKMRDEIDAILLGGDDAIASVVASHKTAIEEALDEINTGK